MANNIITPRRKEEFFDRNGDPTLRFIRWMELVTGQTNTTSTTVEGSSIFGNYGWPSGDPSSDENNFNYPAIQREESQIRAVTATSNYTALPYDFVNAKNNSTITFPLYPIENSVIIVRNGDGSTIKLSGNGRNMNGEPSGELTRQGTSIEFYYFIESNEWFAR
jgi:hypothetical protein